MTQLIKEMREIYRIRHYDFMGYKFKNVDDLSYHHLVKKCDGGLRTLDNGALLVRDTAHPYLHLIESIDYDRYLYLNSILTMINNQKSHPTIEQLKVIRQLLLEFEALHINDTTKKGKKILKKEFITGRIKL